MLSAGKLQEIKQGVELIEKELPELQKDIADAQRAGVSVVEQQARLRLLKDKVRKIKAVYLEGGKGNGKRS